MGEWEVQNKFTGTINSSDGSLETIFKLEKHSRTGEKRAYGETVGGVKEEIPVDLFKVKAKEVNNVQ